MAKSFGSSFTKSFTTQAGPTGGLRAGPGERTGTRVTEFGKADFQSAVIDWEKVFSAAEKGLPQAQDLIDQFAPGGSFGAGRKREARELIGQGVARDTAAAVASGTSSMSSARGLNVLAGRELATQFGNIEDATAQLQLQAFQPYTQMIASLAGLASARPARRQFVDIVQTPLFGDPGRGGTSRRI